VVRKIPDFIDTVVIIDDKSKQELPIKLIKECTNLNLCFLENEKNLGVGGATKCGFKYAIQNNADIVIKVDADDQMDLEFLPEMIKVLLKDKAQVAKGNRFKDTRAINNMPIIRRFGNLGLSFLAKISTGYWNNFDPTNGFLAIKVKTLKEIDFSKLEDRYFFETSLMAELYFYNAKIKDIKMPAIYANEKSNMKVWQMPFVFSKKLIGLLIKRLLKSYFIYDFNIGSIYFLFGNLLFFFGCFFGLVKWSYYSSIDTPAPTGTIMIATISLILGFQLLLQFIQYDIFNAPKAS
jgi:hypothetical protein